MNRHIYLYTDVQQNRKSLGSYPIAKNLIGTSVVSYSSFKSLVLTRLRTLCFNDAYWNNNVVSALQDAVDMKGLSEKKVRASRFIQNKKYHDPLDASNTDICGVFFAKRIRRFMPSGFVVQWWNQLSMCTSLHLFNQIKIQQLNKNSIGIFIIYFLFTGLGLV